MQVIILDEAHERTVQTDVLFSLVKSAQVIPERPCSIWQALSLQSLSQRLDKSTPMAENQSMQNPPECCFAWRGITDKRTLEAAADLKQHSMHLPRC